MKRLVLFFVCCVFFIHTSKSQCSPDFIYTSLSLPGVYPPAISIPGSPVPLGVSEGQVGFAYDQTLTLVVLEDTTLDISPLLDPAVVSAMNLAGINPVMSLDVNHVIYQVEGLPNGVSYTCDQNTCQYSSGVDGCILLSGSPIQAGVFPVSVKMTINVQMPAITDPIFGTVIMPATGIDLPTFSVVDYDMVINIANNVVDYNSEKNILFPNPAYSASALFLEEKSDIIIYNVLGEEICKYYDVIDQLIILKSELGSGIFYITIYTSNKKTTRKLIIK